EQGSRTRNDWHAPAVRAFEQCLFADDGSSQFQANLSGPVSEWHWCAVRVGQSAKFETVVLAQFRVGAPKIDSGLIAVRDAPDLIGRVNGGGERSEEATKGCFALASFDEQSR